MNYNKLHQEIEYKIAAEYIKNNPDYNPEKTVIISRKPYVSFYSNSKIGGPSIPYTSSDNIINLPKLKKLIIL